MNDKESDTINFNYDKFIKMSIDALKTIEKNIQDNSTVHIDYSMRTKIEDTISLYYEKIKK
jgi:hypothetical protein